VKPPGPTRPHARVRIDHREAGIFGLDGQIVGAARRFFRTTRRLRA
jgi:hypothetical protein